MPDNNQAMSVPRWKFGEELDRVENGVDFGGLVAYFVRLSVVTDDGGTEWVSLTPNEADIWQGSCAKPPNSRESESGMIPAAVPSATRFGASQPLSPATTRCF